MYRLATKDTEKKRTDAEISATDILLLSESTLNIGTVYRHRLPAPGISDVTSIAYKQVCDV